MTGRSRPADALLACLFLGIVAACDGGADGAGDGPTAPLPGGSLSPEVAFSSYLGSFGEAREVAFDSEGNLVIVGWTSQGTANFPADRTTRFGPLGRDDAYVVKLSADGSELMWAVVLGGSGLERGYGVALDGSANVYIGGQTSRQRGDPDDFPTTAGAFDRTNNGGSPDCFGPHGCDVDAYAAKISADGKRLLYSTFLGSSDDDGARGGIAVDGRGSAYVVGFTGADDFLDEGGGRHPAKRNAYAGGRTDGFIVKLSPEGSAVEYARFIGVQSSGPHGDVVVGAAVDDARRAHVNAILRGPGAPTTPGAFQPGFGGGVSDGYYARLTPDGRELEYATYLGGSREEYAEHRIEVDRSGNVYLAGQTGSGDFPTVDAHQASPGGDLDGYLVKLDSSGRPVFSTLMGGSDEDASFGPAVDGDGIVFVTGPTQSSDFPTTEDAFQSSHGGKRDIFLRAYGADGSLLYSTYFGGGEEDRTRFVEVGADGSVALTGGSSSPDYTVTEQAYDPTFNGQWDGVVTKLRPRSQ